MKLRIRKLILLCTLFIGLVPMALATLITYERSLGRENQDARERQTKQVRNLTAGLQDYQRDLTKAVQAVASSLETGTASESQKILLSTYGVQRVDLVDRGTGSVIASTVSASAQQLAPPTIAKLTRYADVGSVGFTPVQIMPNGREGIYAVSAISDQLIVARVDTRHFKSLAEQHSYGSTNRAFILDQQGNALSQPLEAWFGETNDAALASVKALIDQNGGVARIALGETSAESIVAVGTLGNSGWSVVSARSAASVEDKIFDNLFVLFAGFLLVAGLTVLLIVRANQAIVRPIENLCEDMLVQAKIGAPRTIAPERACSNVIELKGIVEAYNDLALATTSKSNQLADKIYEDTVTSIGNRLYFNTTSKKQIDIRVAKEKGGVLILMDLDGFKEINDIRGHAVGDQVLKSFAKSLYPITKRFMDKKFRGVTGSYPVVGRLGGDEFAILLPLAETDQDISSICEELRQSFPTTIEVDGGEVSFGVSAGGAEYPAQGTSVDELVRRADVALYRAKSDGKRCFRLYARENALGNKSEILAGVVKAIKEDELVLAYQPKVHSGHYKVAGVEALVRWNHPVHGLITPNLFLPAIEQTAVMKQLGEWAVARAIDDVRAMEASGHELKVAVNIGAEHFTAADFVPCLIEICRKKAFPHARLQIEITENVMSASQSVFEKTVQELQSNGFVVAIDDFGSGFSNLSRIASVPVDTIKLDRSLIKDAVSENRIHAVMRSAITMAHELGSCVVLEGVETLEQLKLAEDAGADAIQGYYFSKPLMPTDLLDWLDQRSTSGSKAQLEELGKALSA